MNKQFIISPSEKTLDNIYKNIVTEINFISDNLREKLSVYDCHEEPLFIIPKFLAEHTHEMLQENRMADAGLNAAGLCMWIKEQDSDIKTADWVKDARALSSLLALCLAVYVHRDGLTGSMDCLIQAWTKIASDKLNETMDRLAQEKAKQEAGNAA